VSVLDNQTGSSAAADCAIRTVRRFRFHSGPQGGSVSYLVGFTFTPGQ
jgi:hypothetical protein